MIIKCIDAGCACVVETMEECVVVLDNGAGFIKAGLAGDLQPLKVFPNGTAKLKGERLTLVGDQIMDSKDILSLTIKRPFSRGYLTSVDLQREIWARAFKHVLKVTQSHGLCCCHALVTLMLWKVKSPCLAPLLKCIINRSFVNHLIVFSAVRLLQACQNRPV